MSWSSYRHLAEKEAYSAVSPTCSHVDAALETASQAIKKQTEALREALIDACQRALQAEAKVDDLESAVSRLEREVDDLKDTVSDLEGQLREAKS
jgi:predicted  nucleic acid-binding Zn-ribbon protein